MGGLTKEFESLRKWFIATRRALPWRQTFSPYAVWVSEVMLQQTQVATVIPYFKRWMERYPTLEILAKTPLSALIKEWEGLGYYARVKNLHKGANYVLENFGGKLPEDVISLQKIPGLGPYTIGAIRAFAFRQRAAAVDGNVFRVLCRYFAIREDISKHSVQKKIREIAERILPEYAPWEIAEAWIELGALICKKKPMCEKCPLNSRCQAYKLGLREEFPYKSTRTVVTDIYRFVPILLHKKEVLIRQIPEGQIMGGLCEFPFFEVSKQEFQEMNLMEKIPKEWNFTLSFLQKLSLIKHNFTRYQAHLKPVIFRCSAQYTPEGYFWVSLMELDKYPFSSGHRRILAKIKFAS